MKDIIRNKVKSLLLEFEVSKKNICDDYSINNKEELFELINKTEIFQNNNLFVVDYKLKHKDKETNQISGVKEFINTIEDKELQKDLVNLDEHLVELKNEISKGLSNDEDTFNMYARFIQNIFCNKDYEQNLN
tara:strand:- start:715 stop:1113 length:399 start_codon:yes stop_codon:yes gene_type:complete